MKKVPLEELISKLSQKFYNVSFPVLINALSTGE